MNVLVDEICRRVQAKVNALENVQDTADAGDKPKLLVLTEKHGTICHETLENAELAECYQTECALLKEFDCKMEDYEAVIVYTMSNEALGRIAHGIFGCGFTRLFGQALLAGKKIFLAREGIELLRYRDSAPAPYYKCLEQNLQLLKDSGVVIAPHAQIADLILHGTPQSAAAKAAKETAACAVNEKAASAAVPKEGDAGKTASLTKRIVTEKDMIELGNERVRTVVVSEKAILTDLAREYAAKHRMTVQRGQISSEKEKRSL